MPPTPPRRLTLTVSDEEFARLQAMDDAEALRFIQAALREAPRLPQEADRDR